MSSTYTTNLRVEKMANGENDTTWGTKTNTNWEMIEQAVSGVASVAMTDAEYTLTTANAATDEARNMVITMTGTLTANRNVIVPSVDKLYVVKNSTTGGFSIVVKTAAGTGITIPNGETATVYCDATNVVLAQTGGLTTQILVGGGASALPVWTAATGSGAPVRATSPALLTPNIGVATATSISFGDEALSAYDEGTFTPAVTFTTPGDLAVAYGGGVQYGYYTRIGRLVTVQLIVNPTLTFSTASGSLRVTGLPFTSAAISGGAHYIPASIAGGTTYPSGTTHVVGAVAPGGTYLNIAATGSGGSGFSTFSASNITSGAVVYIRVYGTYHV